MLSSNVKNSAEDAWALVQKQKDKRKATENYNWINESYDINFLEFTKNFRCLRWFQTLMDISSWKDFAAGLGLIWDEIKWCEMHNKYGPTEEVFTKLMEKGMLQNLSLGDILSQLRELNLKDILSRVNWQEDIEKFRKGQLDPKPQEMPPRIGYECGLNFKKNLSSNGDTFSLRIVQAPEVLVNSANLGTAPVEGELCKRTPKAKPKSKFGANILMLFACDAKSEALQAANQLKMAHGDRQAIGVMLLTGSPTATVVNALMQDPGNSIHKWFTQVDYVVPVLSLQFLRQIQCRDSDPSTKESMYNRYVYRLLLDDYVANMSKNHKCRALYAADACTEVRNSEIVKGNGLLQYSWNCSSEEQVEDLANILIDGAVEKRSSRTRSSV